MWLDNNLWNHIAQISDGSQTLDLYFWKLKLCLLTCDILRYDTNHYQLLLIV